MSVRVRRPGLLTTIQDLGRYGLQHIGIVPCGAMDPVAHCVANALVGNSDAAATLECTLVGPELEFEEDALVALYGASFQVKSPGFSINRPVLVKGGTVLALGSAWRGSRAYLAIAGGFAVPEVLGSRSTYLPAGFGGFEGRALKAGDCLDTVADMARLSAERFSRMQGRWTAPELTVPPKGALTVRAMDGRHQAQFDEASRAAFFAHEWRISPTSNRMGYRLEGPPLKRTRSVENLSEPTCLGTVQVPNDGAPILLMADHQTTGGYPKIAEVASADMPLLAQLAPGARIRFTPCSIEEAQQAEDRSLERLRLVQKSIRERLKC